MTQQEQARLQVLNNLLAGYMTTEQAATLMGVSTRHTRRILAAYRERGAAALAHGNRGRSPANATPSALASKAVRLARSRYAGVNHTHLSELLREREGIRSHVTQDTDCAGVNSPRRRRPPKHRVRRQRMPREGMLIQVDGSYHRWLGEDGPQFTLLLAVDDATGVVADALFCELENTHSYFSLLDGLIRRCGIPIALYADRHAVFKYTPPSEAAAAPTQFSRAMDELGVQLIFARSPQAKGRVERMAGTFQDRLVTELRLAGAITIDVRVLADFLPRFNQRFRVPPQHTETAYRVPDAPRHNPLPEVQAQGRPGQHGEVPLAYPAVTAWHGPTELCRSGGGCTRGWTDSWQCSTRGRSSPHRRHRSAPISCATSPREPHILLRLISTAMAWADAG